MIDSVSVIIPSVYRPARLRRCVEAVLRTYPPADVICSLSFGDDESRAALAGLRVRITDNHPPLTGAVRAVNEALELALGNYIAFVMDDSLPEMGWKEEALWEMARLPEASGVVGINDLVRGPRDGDRFAVSMIAARQYLVDFNGGVFFTPHYFHYYCDIELCERASAVGRYIWAERSVIRHERGKDKVTDSALPKYGLDMALYNQRRQAGYPSDYQAVII